MLLVFVAEGWLKIFEVVEAAALAYVGFVIGVLFDAEAFLCICGLIGVEPVINALKCVVATVASSSLSWARASFKCLGRP